MIEYLPAPSSADVDQMLAVLDRQLEEITKAVGLWVATSGVDFNRSYVIGIDLASGPDVTVHHCGGEVVPLASRPIDL